MGAIYVHIIIHPRLAKRFVNDSSRTEFYRSFITLVPRINIVSKRNFLFSLEDEEPWNISARRRSWRPRCPACRPYGNLVTNRHRFARRSSRSGAFILAGSRPRRICKHGTARCTRWQTTSYCAFPRFHWIHSTSFAPPPLSLLSSRTADVSSFLLPPPPLPARATISLLRVHRMM